MGSSGNGMFGTYRDSGAGSITNENNSADGCPLVVENINLEDVAISEFFEKHNDVPCVNGRVALAMELIDKRLAIVLMATNEVIGNLPVSCNYLYLCIKKGMRYSGIIKSSGLSPIPYIVVSINA